MPGIILNWFQSYLCDRKQFISLGISKSSLQNVTLVCRKGPLLFLLYTLMISITVLVNQTVKLFAGDTNVFYGTTLPEVYGKVNKAIMALSEWFYANKLSVNVEKSCYSLFG